MNEREELLFLQKIFREIQPELGTNVVEAFWLAIADRYPDWAWAIDVRRFKHIDESYLMLPGEVHRHEPGELNFGELYRLGRFWRV